MPRFVARLIDLSVVVVETTVEPRRLLTMRYGTLL